MRYFAYGSNLNRDDLAHWCRERNVPGIEMGPGRSAYLPDRRLAFTHRSSSRGGGVLDVPPSIGCAVSGIAFELNADTLAALDRKESDGHVYRNVETALLYADGSECRAFTYEVEPSHREPFVAPPASYLDVVRIGYGVFGLDRAPLEAAARNTAHPGPVSRLFVYGTLMRGEERHPALERNGAEFLGTGHVRGTLHDFGPHPGLSTKPSDVVVAGELYEASDLGGMFAELDEIEGFRGFGVPGSWYRRAMFRAASDAGEPLLAWIYVLAGDAGGAPVIASGDWRRRQDVP